MKKNLKFGGLSSDLSCRIFCFPRQHPLEKKKRKRNMFTHEASRNITCRSLFRGVRALQFEWALADNGHMVHGMKSLCFGCPSA